MTNKNTESRAAQLLGPTECQELAFYTPRASQGQIVTESWASDGEYVYCRTFDASTRTARYGRIAWSEVADEVEADWRPWDERPAIDDDDLDSWRAQDGWIADAQAQDDEPRPQAPYYDDSLIDDVIAPEHRQAREAGREWAEREADASRDAHGPAWKSGEWYPIDVDALPLVSFSPVAEIDDQYQREHELAAICNASARARWDELAAAKAQDDVA